MDAYVLDWANLLLRWTHVIVAIAWIGSSFYFVFLDFSLKPPTDPALRAKGVDGELWAVHGGGFYNPQKYVVAPPALPEHLHWFYWESYWTWMSGFALFVVLYLVNADTFLVDRNVHDWSGFAAAATSLVFLVGFWVAYDAICRVFGPRRHGDLIVGALVFAVVVLAAWLACRLFAGRAAFLLTGAMLATAMTANVGHWIIPGQRKVVAQLRAGQPVDPVHGQRAKQRSVHNTYFTLPVLVAMLSNHYGWLYQARHNWLVLVALMLAGALIRHAFVARHKAKVAGRRVPWEYAGVGVAIIVAVGLAIAPRESAEPAAPAAGASGAAAAVAPAPGLVTLAQVQPVIEQRCVICHNATLHQKNVELHTPERIQANAQLVYQQAVVLKTMPLNNATQMTDAERALVKRWYEGSMRTR
ncbi:urate hydroxylase PuuD [Piscinibacter koreensis]|uniref:Urate hydroxylase PuuD n=1 Tax=Piscinibacter koreensis TaxID=2742824 RepID=A0A7Y6NPF2_9BURK|nr:urate hydroxylase PuuD [Schlegelella koreensis]NUZ06916.1 urate hydroxylase PuuD [Schlegelella koreensis]